MALIDVSVPDIGDFKDVAVIEILVKPGDTIAVEQSLLTVESDKASMEIPSSHAGVAGRYLHRRLVTLDRDQALLDLDRVADRKSVV